MKVQYHYQVRSLSLLRTRAALHITVRDQLAVSAVTLP